MRAWWPLFGLLKHEHKVDLSRSRVHDAERLGCHRLATATHLHSLELELLWLEE